MVDEDGEGMGFFLVGQQAFYKLRLQRDTVAVASLLARLVFFPVFLEGGQGLINGRQTLLRVRHGCGKFLAQLFQLDGGVGLLILLGWLHRGFLWL